MDVNFIGRVVFVTGLQAKVLHGVNRQRLTARIVLQRPVIEIDILQGHPDPRHETARSRIEMHGVRVRALARADGKVQSLERQRRAPE